MPPKASRHRWGSDERDVLHILFIEYRLQALGGSKTEIDAGTDIAHALFSELFPWASNERNKVRDQWRTRLAPRRPSTWKSAHEKSLVNYTPEERANRARLRVLIVQAAVNQGIILNPPTLFLELHNAAKTTALAVGPVTSEEIAAAAASGGSAQTQGSLDLGITVAHTATPSPRKTLAKPRQKDRKLLFSPGEGSRITQTTTKVQKDQIPGLNSNSICMVHRSQVVPFENRGESGLELISRYQCQLDDLMDSTSPVWLAGGPVLRVLVRDSSQQAGRSASNDRQGVLRDVMLCQYGVCFSCNIGSRRAYKPYTTPFVHRKACVVGNGKIIFAPSARARRDQVVNCLVEVEQKLVNYLLPRGDGVEGVKNTPIMSSVCIVRSCAVCRTSTELVPTRKRIEYTLKPSRPKGSSALSSRGFMKSPLASKRPGESLQTPPSKRRYFGNSGGINQRQIRSRNGETGQGSGKQHVPGQSDPSSTGAVNAQQIGIGGTASGSLPAKPGSGKVQQDQSIPIGAQEKSDTTKPSEPPRRLQMIHRDQLFTNIGNVGPVRPDETKWWTNYGSIFKEGPAWEQGGEAALVLVRGSLAGKFVEWHLMVCNPKYCPDCLPEGSDNGPGPFGGRPFVHTSECERSPQGTSFNPPRNSILIRRETDYARSGPKNVWFSEDGERFLVEALMCDTSRCRFCTTQPASPSGNGGASRENGRDTTPNSGKRAQEDRSSAPPNSGEASQVDGRGFALLEPGRVDDTDATLRMVHYRDLTPNEDEDGFTPDGVPQMTTEHRHIFAAPEKMWRLGGSVMNVLVLETTRNGQHIPAAEYHLMVCDRDFCESCVASSATARPGFVVKTKGQWYKGFPFVHRKDCVVTAAGLTFSPHWAVGNFGQPQVTAYQDTVTFFEAGKRIKARSWVCVVANCFSCTRSKNDPRPTLDSENMLRMVHRRDLHDNKYQDHFADGRQSRYACLWNRTFGRAVSEWHRGGSVTKLFVPDENHPMLTRRRADAPDVDVLSEDDPAGEVLDIMLCQWGRCQSCPLGARLAYKSSRSPFVHSKDCVEDEDAGTLTFQNDCFDDLRMESSATRQATVVFSNIRRDQGAPATIQSAVCLREECSVCVKWDEEQAALRKAQEEEYNTEESDEDSELSDPEPQTKERDDSPEGSGLESEDSASESEDEEPPTKKARTSRAAAKKAAAKKTAVQKSAVTKSAVKQAAAKQAAVKTPAVKKAAAKKAATVPAVLLTTGPHNPLGPGLRMCHTDQLQITATNIDWIGTAGLRAQTTDLYYIAEDHASYLYGGQVFHVTLPDGTIVEVMGCVRARCQSDNKSGIAADFANSPLAGRPFVHRRDLTVINGLSTFTPGALQAIETFRPVIQMQSRQVRFAIAGKTLQTRVCVAGGCRKCG